MFKRSYVKRADRARKKVNRETLVLTVVLVATLFGLLFGSSAWFHAQLEEVRIRPNEIFTDLHDSDFEVLSAMRLDRGTVVGEAYLSASGMNVKVAKTDLASLDVDTTIPDALLQALLTDPLVTLRERSLSGFPGGSFAMMSSMKYIAAQFDTKIADRIVVPELSDQDQGSFVSFTTNKERYYALSYQEHDGVVVGVLALQQGRPVDIDPIRAFLARQGLFWSRISKISESPSA